MVSALGIEWTLAVMGPSRRESAGPGPSYGASPSRCKGDVGLFPEGASESSTLGARVPDLCFDHDLDPTRWASGSYLTIPAAGLQEPGSTGANETV